MRLTPAQRERFETEGRLFLPGLFEADELVEAA